MIEKVNIGQVMNQYQIVTDADHVYVEKGNSQGKINKSDLISKLLAASELDKIKIISKSVVVNQKLSEKRIIFSDRFWKLWLLLFSICIQKRNYRYSK
mgnify:CR=1 FL=1